MTQGILQIKASDRFQFTGGNVHETADDGRTILLNNTTAAVNIVGIEVPGQAMGMTRRIFNRGTQPVTIVRDSAEAPTAQRFNAGATIPARSYIDVVCEGVGWAPVVAASADLEGTGDLANTDTVQVTKAAVSREVVGTLDGGTGTTGGFTIGNLTRTWAEIGLTEVSSVGVAEYLEANKSLIPAESIVDNEDSTFTITFAPGVNTAPTTSTDPNLTFEETVAGLPIRTQTVTLEVLTQFITG